MRSNKLDTRNRAHTIAVSALAALWLSACGGGGGGDPVMGPAQSPAPTAGSPAPSPVPATPISVTANTVAQANRTHEVLAAGTAGVSITLPAQPNAGDTVRVTGISASPWSLVPNAGQTILTTGVAGNMAPGASWTVSPLTPTTWHWISSNETGEVLVAGVITGQLYTSTDGGTNWTTGGSPSQRWISVDMTPSGDRIVAVAFGGDMFTSTDFGQSWQQITSTTVPLSGRNFESVTVSRNGDRIVTNVLNGGIYYSTDAGANWARGTLADGSELTSGWRAIDGTLDGQFLISVSQDRLVYVSNDFGATWAPRPVLVGTTPALEGWYRVAMSDNAEVIAMGANQFGGGPATGVYISTDRGLSWTRNTSVSGDITAIDVSGDGRTIAVTVSSTAGAPGVFLSNDAGATFTAVTPADSSDTLWRGVAVSGDGNKLATVAGFFLDGTAGQLYTSLGNRTAYGGRGALTGGQGQSVDLEYLGNGRFSVRNSSGGAFTIR